MLDRIAYIYDEGKLVEVTYLISKFKTMFGKSVVNGKDDNGKSYTKTCYYLKSQPRISLELIDWYTNGCPANVRKVLHYIIHHMEYGKNYLTISNKDVCQEEPNLDSPSVSTALKELKKRDIIVRAKDLDLYKDNSKVGVKLYIVNHNHIFNGNYINIRHQFKLQGAYPNEDKVPTNIQIEQ